METKRLRLEGASLVDLQARVLAEHGDGARIVAAEQVTIGGIRGFFAKRHVEVTVEVPVEVPVEVFVAAPGPRRRGAHLRDERTVRLGIAALLDEADEAEARLQGGGAPLVMTALPATAIPAAAARETVLPPVTLPPVTPPEPVPPAHAVSTATPDFARLMDELTFATSPARGAAPALPVAPDAEALPAVTPGAPGLLTGPGDLVLLVGPQSDVLEAARLLSTGLDAPIGDSSDRITDRRTALAARARGVERGRSVLVTCAVPENVAGAPAPPLALLQADQVWAVVHAGRKPADTVRWVHDTGLIVPIDALAVLGVESTDTPGTVAELGLPIGWLAPKASAPKAFGPKNPIAIG